MRNVTKSLAPAWLSDALMQRVTLLVNHVLLRESAATERLRAHAGRRLQLTLDGWPRWLPPPPPLRFSITAAGLLDWVGDETEAAPPSDLEMRLAPGSPLDLLAPARLRQRLEINGDAALAADISWVVEHVRWDVGDDLARITGPAAARRIEDLGRQVARGLRSVVDGIAGRTDDPPRPGDR